jgi:hypothetical protein
VISDLAQPQKRSGQSLLLSPLLVVTGWTQRFMLLQAAPGVE